jgi:2,4-dienoyl-CoA reductase-like NADH-dependent reductase (Old Yellow Enzyme family)
MTTITSPVSRLAEPLVFRNGVRARNRAWLAPMTNQQSHADGTLSKDELHWLEMRARGGFGAVETCAAYVAKDGQGWPGELGIYDDQLVRGLKRLAGTLASHGALPIAQLFHGGLRAPSSLTGTQSWTASALADPNQELEPSRAATEEDIRAVIDRFRSAALRAHEAGFAGVELHGAHGYLLCQFLSKTMNLRTDAWGGSIEGRARLIREATRAVRSSVPDRFLVGVRMSPEDRGNGLDLDESIQVARWLSEDGVDFLHLSFWNARENTKKRPGEHAVPLFRAAIPRDVVLIAAGSIWTGADADELFEQGADAVAVAKAAIANPDWALRASDATWEPRRPPLDVAELKERGVSERFVEYLRTWKGFVSG